jgi:glutathione S-transferase
MPISGNVMPAVMLAMDKKCGGMEFKDMLKDELKTPEMLAINPWAQMPSMSDGDFAIAESNAILRYIAHAYAPETYGGAFQASAFDTLDKNQDGVITRNEFNAAMQAKKAEIDWALDWISTNFYNNFKMIWYPVAGFGTAPEDQKAENDKAVQNLTTFANKFLTDRKFVGGESLSIADYKLGVWCWYLGHDVIKAKTGYENPPRITQYVNDFLAATSSKEFLDAADGFMKSKIECADTKDAFLP